MKGEDEFGGDCRAFGVSVDDGEGIPFYELVGGQLVPSTKLTAGERYGIRVAVALERAKRVTEGRP